MTRLQVASFVLLVLGPAAAVPSALAAPTLLANRASLVVQDDLGLGAEVATALRTLAVDALRDHGVAVSEDDEGPRRFVVRLGGQFGRKIPLSLEERDGRGAVVASASLVLLDIEEADRALPRLVAAVLARTSASAEARVGTVVASEAEAPNKRASEGVWIAGASLNPAGFGLGWALEGLHQRVGLTFEGSAVENGVYTSADDVTVFLGATGTWLFRDAEWTPYVGAAAGILGTIVGDQERDDPALRLEAGLELGRLQRFRFMIGGDLTLSARETRPGLHVRVALR